MLVNNPSICFVFTSGGGGANLKITQEITKEAGLQHQLMIIIIMILLIIILIK